MKIEVSNGEIVDKLTILLIKKDNIKDKVKLKNIEKEIVVNTNRQLFYPPSYYGGPYRKNLVYAPDVYVAPGPYARRYANRRFRGYW